MRVTPVAQVITGPSGTAAAGIAPAFAGAATAVVEEPWVILDIKTPEVSPEEIVYSGIIDIAEDLTLVKPLEKKRA